MPSEKDEMPYEHSEVTSLTIMKRHNYWLSSYAICCLIRNFENGKPLRFRLYPMNNLLPTQVQETDYKTWSYLYAERQPTGHFQWNKFKRKNYEDMAIYNPLMPRRRSYWRSLWLSGRKSRRIRHTSHKYFDSFSLFIVCKFQHKL